MQRSESVADGERVRTAVVLPQVWEVAWAS